MLKKLFERVSGVLGSDTPETGESRTATLRLATTVLMAEVARADHDFAEEEFERLIALAARHFRLTADEAAELAVLAEQKAEESVSLHDFTQLLHQHLDDDEKGEVVSLLWQVAFADGRLDKYEDALVLKISDLLHVSRGLVMRLKHDAQG